LEPTPPTMSLVQPVLIPIVTTDKVNTSTSSDLSVITVPCYCPDQVVVGPMWIRGSGPEISLVTSNRVTESQQHANDPHLPTIPVPSQQLSDSVHFQSSSFLTREQFTEEEDSTERSNVPVDLCNSAICLQMISDKIADFPLCALSTEKSTVPSSHLESDGAELVTFLSDSSLLDQTAALDLTEPPSYITLPIGNDVMDLSGDATFAFTPPDPIDLSAPQPQRKDSIDRTMVAQVSDTGPSDIFACTSAYLRSHQPLSNWDPEPGFSFTDLLTNNDVDDPDTIFNYLLSTDRMSVHSSPCKSSISITSHTVTDTAVSAQPPLDLRLPHAPVFSL
uniref:Clathrin_bdg domain-containing protein n=1 Tax=Echinostoma caproni TaxID=27848 RepID=A0A183B8G7_9TREM